MNEQIIGHNIQNVTIFTDASFKDGNVGGGYWIVYGDKQKLTGSINFKEVPRVTDAELFVSLHAIDVALNDDRIVKWMDTCDQIRVVLVTDALSTKHIFEKVGGEYEKINNLKITKRGKNNKFVLFKVNHVKAHTNEKSSRSYVNRWCDDQARNARLAINRTTGIFTL